MIVTGHELQPIWVPDPIFGEDCGVRAKEGLNELYAAVAVSVDRPFLNGDGWFGVILELDALARIFRESIRQTD